MFKYTFVHGERQINVYQCAPILNGPPGEILPLIIPSQSFYYMSLDGRYKIPYPANDPQRWTVDIQQWSSNCKQIFPLIYIPPDRNMHGLLTLNKHLHKLGVIHFTAPEVYYLGDENLKHILQYMYELPTTYINHRLQVNTFYRQAKDNLLARSLIDRYDKQMDDKYIQLINLTIHNSVNTVLQKLQTTHLSWVISNPDIYIQPWSTTDIEYMSDNQLHTYILPDEQPISRSDLIQKVKHAFQTSHVRFLTKEQARNCTLESQKTIFDMADLPDTYIGIGNWSQGFICYDIQDILQTLSIYAPLGILKNPHTQKSWNPIELYQIINLYKDNPNIQEQLLSYTQKYNPNTQIKELRQHLLVPGVKEVFLQIFYLGMYLRRWSGDGPYPLTEELVEGHTFQSQCGLSTAIASTEAGIKLHDELNKLPMDIQQIINNLHLMNKVDQEYIPEYQSIQSIIQDIGDQNACIRVASGLIAYTGAYYLYIIFNEYPPGFDLYRDNIAGH